MRFMLERQEILDIPVLQERSTSEDILPLTFEHHRQK